MILSDFLSRQIEDDSNPQEIFPISFNIWDILQERYHHMVMDTYKVQTRAQVKAQASAPTAVNAPPVAQKATSKVVKLPIETEKEKEVKMLPSRIVQQPPRGILLPQGSMLHPIIMPPNARPPPKPPYIDKTITSTNLGLDLNMDIEENLPHQEGIITKTYVAPDQS